MVLKPVPTGMQGLVCIDHPWYKNEEIYQWHGSTEPICLLDLGSSIRPLVDGVIRKKFNQRSRYPFTINRGEIETPITPVKDPIKRLDTVGVRKLNSENRTPSQFRTF